MIYREPPKSFKETYYRGKPRVWGHYSSSHVRPSALHGLDKTPPYLQHYPTGSTICAILPRQN